MQCDKTRRAAKSAAWIRVVLSGYLSSILASLKRNLVNHASIAIAFQKRRNDSEAGLDRQLSRRLFDAYDSESIGIVQLGPEPLHWQSSCGTTEGGKQQ